MTVLDLAPTLRTLQASPSNRLGALSGDRSGQYSIRVTAPWRIGFRWQVKDGSDAAADRLESAGDAADVEITDYH